MKRRLLILLSSALTTVFVGDGAAQSDPVQEIRELRAVIERLLTKVEAQEARLTALEKAAEIGRPRDESAGAQRGASGVTGGWKNPKNWKLIKHGMSESQVTEILGRPTSIDGSQWYYEGSVVGSGNVTGNIFWGSHRVLVVHEPAW